MSARLAAALRREAEEIRCCGYRLPWATYDEARARREHLLDRADAANSDRPEQVAA